MRVLMINRNDVYKVPGGDTIQMVQTKKQLEKLGVEIDENLLEGISINKGIDIIHIFNWEMLEQFYLSPMVRNVNGLPPVVLSPIFWFFSGHWFDEASSKKPIWRMVRKGVGHSKARNLYLNWQIAKFRYGERGRNFRKLLSNVKKILPNSKTETDHLKYVLNLNDRLINQCLVVPNGVDQKLYDPIPSPSEAFFNEYGLRDFILQVARIQFAKNQLGLIEALFDTTIPIVFIGQPSPYEREYVDQCYRLAKKRGNVYFISPKSQEELAGIYALAAVHVLPSWRETPGLVSLEAAASGCKIVSTTMGSAKEYFGDLAWYCEPSDIISIRNSVLKALDAPRSLKLRQVVLEKYTWEVAAQKTLEAYIG
jgi:glycosyltransferase involved in cell wall biosynthesis